MIRVKYLGEHHANGSAPVWKFLAAVTAGQAAGFAAGSLTRRAFHRDALATKDAVDLFVGTGVFTIVSGLTWIFLTRKP